MQQAACEACSNLEESKTDLGVPDAGDCREQLVSPAHQGVPPMEVSRSLNSRSTLQLPSGALRRAGGGRKVSCKAGSDSHGLTLG